MLFDRVRWKAAIVWECPVFRLPTAHKIDPLDTTKTNKNTQAQQQQQQHNMLFLYNSVPTLVRKHGTTAFGSFFDDDFTPSRHRVQRSSLVGGDDDKNDPSGAFHYTLDVPGVKPSDLQVTIEQNVLTIQGETKKHRKFHKIMTISNTDETDLSQLTAQLADGVLTLTAPIKAKPAPVKVPVTSNDTIEQEEERDEQQSNVKNDGAQMMMRRAIEIPGVPSSDVHVTLEEGTTLHVRGMRRGKIFDTTFRMDTDQINTSALTADLSHGILTVQAPMLPKPEPQIVPIETNATTTADSTVDTTKSDAYVLATMDLPGVRLPDVTVTMIRVDQRQTALDIRASRHYKNKKLRISKLILLDHDTYNVDALKAQLSDGVLTITAPKNAAALPRTIPIVTTTAKEEHPPNEEVITEPSKETDAIVPTETNVTNETTK
jgi:HSP20 family molecular chaperone IbpA